MVARLKHLLQRGPPAPTEEVEEVQCSICCDSVTLVAGKLMGKSICGLSQAEADKAKLTRHW